MLLNSVKHFSMAQLITLVFAPTARKEPEDKEEYTKQHVHHEIPAQNKYPCAHNEGYRNQS